MDLPDGAVRLHLALTPGTDWNETLQRSFLPTAQALPF
jgi:hypothetical protein